MKSSGNKAIKTFKKAPTKMTQKDIKTAEKVAKTSVKTAQATVKASKKAAEAARMSAKVVATGVKATVKTTVAIIKAIIAGIKALIAAIAAGGWVAVVIIIILCLVALIISSVYGIFFSGEDMGNGQTMKTVIEEINTDYEHRISEIKSNTAYDSLEMSGSRTQWKEVLAVYAVKVNTDSELAQDVATIDNAKKEILKTIFWEMNKITHKTETKSEKLITESDDGHGNIIETETTVTKRYLYITITHKTALEMAKQLNFNREQINYINELLKDENNSLWSAVLYGIGTGDGEIVTVALSQVGNIGGKPYWSWYGFNSRVEWCACFVSWCANECGYIESGIIPKYAGCSTGMNWFIERGQWNGNQYEPNAGDIIFFDWDDETGQDGNPDHTGIVEKVENGMVYTIEGNSGDVCSQNTYPVGYYEILGYGVPAY